MSDLTPETLAELRRLLDANEVPWSAHRPSPNYARYEIRDDRGYDLAYTVEDALGGNAEIIVAAVNALPALLDAAADKAAELLTTHLAPVVLPTVKEVREAIIAGTKLGGWMPHTAAQAILDLIAARLPVWQPVRQH